MALQTLPSLDATLAWLQAQGVRALCSDSRRAAPGSAFVAWPGYAVDGRRYVMPALAAGAAACLVEADGAEGFVLDDARVAALADLKRQTGPLASRFYGQPSESLDLLAVTGTNGKTSSSWWLAQSLTALGRRCAVMGTLGIGTPDLPGQPAQIRVTGLTTPDPIGVQQGLRELVDAGFAACAIEASSIGIAEHRLDGARIRVALWTNFTLDHLDYHGNMAAYLAAKQQLFTWPGLRAAVINIDDAEGAALAGRLAASGLDLWTCSSRGPARLRAEGVRYVDEGLAFDLFEGAERVPVTTRLIGGYNVANLLGVLGVLRAMGVTLQDAAAVCGGLTSVPGRMQTVSGPASAPRVVVDYAHTPDALEQALRALRPFAAQRGGRLVCVFGCGGDRDPGKRPLMGAIAAREADAVVLTSDNPRGEAPEAIVDQIAAGLPDHGDCQVLRIVDRRSAIERALASADAADLVLIAGKGHEDYQEIGGLKQHFSDIEEAQRALARWCEVAP